MGKIVNKQSIVCVRIAERVPSFGKECTLGLPFVFSSEVSYCNFSHSPFSFRGQSLVLIFAVSGNYHYENTPM